MATHALNPGEVGTAAFTLAASVVDTVTFAASDYLPAVEVVSDGTAAVWYTLDGSSPTVGGRHCYYIPAVPAVDSRSSRLRQPWSGVSGATVVKLISTGTPVLRVQKGE